MISGFMRSRTSLVLVLAVELLCADAARWRLTTAVLKTNVDYLLGYEVIASEHWRRDGALASHFIPSRSVDQTLPEWSDRDKYWRDYLAQPPLSFMLFHWASRAFNAVEPVVLGRLLAQAQIALGILIAGALLYDVFGFGATFAGLSFLIWSQPFLVWFIDGYYSTTPAMVCQLVLTAWCARFFKRELFEDSVTSPSRIRKADVLAVLVLAYLGVLSEWVALFGNVVAAITFFLIGTCLWLARSPRWWKACAAGVLIGIGSIAAELTTILLFGSRVGYRFYWDAFMDRVAVRSGESIAASPYSELLIRQMDTAWPHGMLVVLVVMLAVVVLFGILRLTIGSPGPARREGGLLLSALAVGFGSGATYCLALKNLVSIHWWFIGTWAIGWTMVVCTFAYAAQAATAQLRHATAGSLSYAVVCSALAAVLVGWNLRFVDLEPMSGRESKEIYPMISGALPHDGAPIVVVDQPNLFDDYPFATAYLRRPVVRYGPSGELFKLGTTEDATRDLAAHRGVVYVAYNPSIRRCTGDDLTPSAWRLTWPVALCRVSIESLVMDRERLFSKLERGEMTALSQWVRQLLTAPDCCDSPRHLLNVTTLLDARLRVSTGDFVAYVREQNASEFRTLVSRWQSFVGGRPDTTGAERATPFVLGILDEGRTWSFLVVNLAGEPLPAFHPGTAVTANSSKLHFVLPFQTMTRDGRASLPVTVFQTRSSESPLVPPLAIEVFDSDKRLFRTSDAQLAGVAGESQPSRNGILAALGGCSDPPGAPTGVRVVSNENRKVVLSWTPAPGQPTIYVLEAGSAPGLIDILQAQAVDTVGTTYTATDVKPRTYYARIRAQNACGTSMASNEVVVVVR